MTTPADTDKTLRVESSDAVVQRPRRGEEQFAPGTVIAGRYRIASILGSGGMGEVYRAEDTKLGQAVALKFLPARLARDPMLLDRLHEEVRLGRLVSHPNVCRIYDIGEADGSHFLAMEYVDGEDLARLLTRIGRLAHDKAVDITRGIAAGLAAAHAKGILHRDLKPPNIMIDSRGDARIMDFGLALADDENDGTVSGTPAYMAPEQLAGEPASVQSDLYALGLVMYELFTGKRAHNARTMPERIRDITSEITTPSNVIRDIDPAVERIILRCLSNEPEQRPRSAREVIAALPGGDPLAAALAAGETPSPRIVAAAGTAGSLKPAVAWTLLALVAVGLALTLYFRHDRGLLAVVPIEKHPEVLADQAAAALRRLGIPAQRFTSRAFEFDKLYMMWVLKTDRSPASWQRLRGGPPAVTFRHEESAEPPSLQPTDAVPRGTTRVALDMKGRIVELQANPRVDWAARPLDWSPLLTSGGIDLATLTPTTPRLLPSAPADVRAAWNGRHPDDGTPIRVEAAAWRGTPVFFRLTGAWETVTRDELAFDNPNTLVFVLGLMVAVGAIGLVLAWRNLRARRGDRQSAFRAAVAIFSLVFAGNLLLAHHYASALYEITVLRQALGAALVQAVLVYVLYLAVEPFIRRRWPDHLIASTRLLSGNVRDPMIGRDVLIGIVGGLAHTAVIVTMMWAAGVIPESGQPVVLAAPRMMLAFIASQLGASVFQAMTLIGVLVTFALLFRHRLLAALGLGAIMTLAYYFATGGVGPATIAATLIAVVIAARYGLLATSVAQASFHLIFHTPQFAGGAWYTLTGMIPVALVCAAAVWAFRTSLGGQRAFAKAFDE